MTFDLSSLLDPFEQLEKEFESVPPLTPEKDNEILEVAQTPKQLFPEMELQLPRLTDEACDCDDLCDQVDQSADAGVEKKERKMTRSR